MECSDYNGQNRRVVMTLTGKPFTIHIEEDKIYAIQRSSLR